MVQLSSIQPPKSISMFVFYFLRHGGTVTGRVIEGHEYSYDLAQDGLQIPVKYSFEGSDSIVKVLKKM